MNTWHFYGHRTLDPPARIFSNGVPNPTGAQIVTDVFSKEKRSEVMRSIKSRGTGLEKDTAKMLRRAKIRYRSHPKAYGSPDFLVEGRLTLFCDGSFWHGRDWKKLRERLEAGDNPDYWVRHSIGQNNPLTFV